MSHIDKVIISSDSALLKKYGAAGKSVIAAAVDRLIAADATRDLTTIYISVDEDTDRDRKNKVDAIYNEHTPHYMVILGAEDVFRHQHLTNPLRSPKDLDEDIPSDLPYACAAPFSEDPADFIAPDRVVSRIPDIPGVTDPTYLEKLLDYAAGAEAPPEGAYSKVLGICAAPWETSTKTSLTSAFGAAEGLKLSPKEGAAWSTEQWGALAHFINCHGAMEDWRFYGQDTSSYPYAHVAHFVAEDAQPGTIVAAECCYGAALYDPTVTSVHPSIANTYLGRGAFGFVGSTNIAYGPSDENGYADHICIDFFRHIRAGQSLGAAMLLARQDYVKHNSPLDPVSLKTLAQFVLYGDPSIYAVPSSEADLDADVPAQTAKGTSALRRTSASRAERRTQATVNSNELGTSTIVSVGRGEQPSPEDEQRVRSIAQNGERASVLTFGSRRGDGRNVTAVEPSTFHVALTSQQPGGEDPEDSWGVTRTLLRVVTDTGPTRTVFAK